MSFARSIDRALITPQLDGERGNMADPDYALLQQMVEQALQQADQSRAERVTIRVGVLRALWEGFERRGAALAPFADLAAELTPQDEDAKPVAARVTCADLRAAQVAKG